jgi:hypothetical protein
VGGSCPQGKWSGNVYTTGAILSDCSVSFSAASVLYSVTPSGANLAISPSAVQSVASGASQAFTVTANAGYTLSSSVGGTCPAGSFSGSVYSTGAIKASCSVSFSAIQSPPEGARQTIASLSAHNISAFSNYDQNHFPANFGTTSYVSRTQTTAIDPTKMDRSMNPVTPGHVSRMDVHSLIPSRPDLRWFVHFMTWYNEPSCNPICIGLNVDTDAYVKALVDDLRRRGFNGLEISWDGPGGRADSIARRVKAYLATLPSGSFSYMLNLDEGMVRGKPNRQAILENSINHIKGQYFGDPNYEKEAGKPLVLFYGMRNQLGAAAMIAAKANTGGSMFWSDVDVGAAFLNESWEDAAYDWHDAHMDGVNPADRYNLGAINNFMSRVGAVSQKKGIGALASSANGTLAPWAVGMYLPQDSGAALVQRAQFINTHIPANVTRMHWVTWNDYPEGTSVEPGIENNVTISAAIQGSNLNWTYSSGTGDESTIDHYEIYTSTNGIDAVYLDSVPTGLHSFSLGARGLKSGTSYDIVLVAVGKPCIRDHVGNSVRFVAP